MFRSGTADVRCAGQREPNIPNSRAPRPRSRSAPTARTGSLINASPDLRQQLIVTPQLHPKAGQLRHSPIAGVILTNGEIDAVAGLLSMREGSPFTLYAHERVLAILKSNSIFNVLGEKNVAPPADRGGQGVRTLPARRFTVRHRNSSLRGSRQGRVVPRRQGASVRRRRRGRHAGLADSGQEQRQVLLFPRRLRARDRRPQIEAHQARRWCSSTAPCGATTN